MSAKNLLHDMALAPACGLTGILTLLHLLYHELKRLEHVLVVSRRGFGPGALELGGECLAVLGRDLALFGAEVGLVTYNDKGDPIDGLYGETWLAVVVACPYGTVGLCRRDNRVARPRKDGQETYKVVEDLVTNDARHLETLLAGHRIDNQVAMDANEVLRIQNAVLILERGIAVSIVSTEPFAQPARLPANARAASLGGGWGAGPSMLRGGLENSRVVPGQRCR